MHSILRSIRNPVLPGLMTLALLQASHAIVIKVTASSEKVDRPSMERVATLLRESWNADEPEARQASGRINGFRFEIAEGPFVPQAFSMTPGTVAYFWSDQTFKFGQGFRFQGNGSMMFGKPLAAREEKPDTLMKAAIEVWTTEFKGASLSASGLRLTYSLESAAPVTLVLSGIDGRALGRWKWTDGSAGSFSKTIQADRLPQSGMVILNWTAGQSRVVKRLTVAPK